MGENRVTASAGGSEEVATTSPKNRVKFLCSHGGKIMPRPIDGQLKYVGGETRVVAIPRDISYSELMKKLAAIAETEVVLKYQLIPEDLDVLVSVRCDEDLNHMLQEYDRYETQLSEGGNNPRFRSFLFPSHPSGENQTNDGRLSNSLEQRYIDALNLVRTPNSNWRSYTSSSINRSAGSSPRSHVPEGYNIDGLNPHSHHNCRKKEIHRVSSSPSLSSLSQQNHPGLQKQQQYAHSYHPPSRLHGTYANGWGGHGRAAPCGISLSRSDFGRKQLAYVPQYASPTRRTSGSWGSNYGPIDEGINRSGEFDRSETHLQP